MLATYGFDGESKTTALLPTRSSYEVVTTGGVSCLAVTGRETGRCHHRLRRGQLRSGHEPLRVAWSQDEINGQ